jgi:hypothetical protein
MVRLSRRDLLKFLAGAAAGSLLPLRSSAWPASEERPFEFLVAGDSLAWGQGLEEKDKFYTLTANWLRDEHFKGLRPVRLKVKAHSGATLKFHADVAEKYRHAGREETHSYPPEVNIGFPSIWKQIEAAAEEYRSDGIDGADLLLLSGGITDIDTSVVFDPRSDTEVLRSLIVKHCRDDMFDVLRHAATLHPKAIIAVVGYFPAISKHSDGKKLMNAWLEILSFPRALKFIPNNPIGRSLFFGRLKRAAIERSDLWLAESSAANQTAVDRLNQEFGRTRAVFVPTPLTEEHAAEAPNTKLFTMGKGGVTKDPLARQRMRECRTALPELKRSTGISYPLRNCEVAAIGHPDKAGSRAYADAIIAKISAHLR